MSVAHIPNSTRLVKVAPWALAGFTIGYCAWLMASGLVWHPGHENDWPLLMWLAHHASPSDLSPLAVGHYGFLQLVVVRAVGPLFSGVLPAAKILNAVAMSLAIALAAIVVWRSADRSRAAVTVIAVAILSLSAEARLSGQSEWADPLALACWAAGVALLLRPNPTVLGLLSAGACIGLAGCFRVHFQAFAFGTVLAYGAAYAQWRPAAWLLVGVLLGQAPAMALNLWVHGKPFSAVAHTFVGQVLFGITNEDLPNTYARHPIGEVLQYHRGEVARFLRARVDEFSRPYTVLLLFGMLALLSRPMKFLRVSTTARPVSLVAEHRFRERLFLLLLALGYFAAFVTFAWYLTPRVLLPLVWICAVLGALTVAAFRPRLRAVFAVLSVPWLFWNFTTQKPAVDQQFADIAKVQEQSETVTRWLRAHGITDPRAVFTDDWNLHATDDPESITFYNFGFWNLLVPTFRAERPNPYPYVTDAPAFARFLCARGVRVIVLSKGVRFPVLLAATRGERELPDYALVADLGGHVAFMLRKCNAAE
jgi:hypothetical protein